MSHRLFKYVCRPWLAWDGPQVSGADGTPFRKDAFNTSTSVPRSTSKGVLRSRTSLVCLQSGHTEACQHLCECFSQWLEGMLSCRSFMVSLQGGADAAVPDAERAGHHTVCHRGPAHGLLLVAAGRPRHPRCLPGHPRCAHACAHPCLRYRALHVHTCILAITLFSRLTGSQRGTVMVVDSDCIHAAACHALLDALASTPICVNAQDLRLECRIICWAITQQAICKLQPLDVCMLALSDAD